MHNVFFSSCQGCFKSLALNPAKHGIFENVPPVWPGGLDSLFGDLDDYLDAGSIASR